MLIFKKVFFLILFIFFISCSKDIKQESLITETNLELQVIEAYMSGLKSLEEGDVLFAAKKFNEAEILFPQSEWAPKSSLMAAYAYYTQDYYGDAIAELERYIKVYPLHKNLDYAYYLLALCFYEQIVDEKKDLQSIENASEKFQFIINKFPNSEYANDSKFKLDLVNDILASKEMYIGRYYFEKKKWIPSINRFKTVVDKYEDTIYIEEALHRLVEIYYMLGLKEEAKKYTILLGYNYQSSEWYDKSYSLFNKVYSNNKKIKQKKINNIKKKFKSLLE